jgi:hypothetical protein
MKYEVLGLAAFAGWYAITAPAHTARTTHAPQGDRWSWHGRIAAGKTVEIRNTNGSVSADLASGAEVEVTAVKRAGRRGNPEDVRIEAVERDGDVRICVIYPGRNFEDGCAQRGQRPHNDDDEENRNDTEVQFTVHVPRGVAFSGNTVNGDVDARALEGPVAGRSVNGGVDIETTAGDASGTSVNGPVHAIVRGQGTEPLRFESVNGQVDVTLPRNLDADVEAATVNGSITTDFEITIQGGMTMHRQRLHGRIGHGGRTLRVETVNGSIHLRAAS